MTSQSTLTTAETLSIAALLMTFLGFIYFLTTLGPSQHAPLRLADRSPMTSYLDRAGSTVFYVDQAGQMYNGAGNRIECKGNPDGSITCQPKK